MSFPSLSAAIVMVATILVAFDRPGGHSLQVYLDDRLVLEQYVTSSTEAPMLRLDPAKSYKKIDVRYNECGRTVTGRKLIIKDSRDNMLKAWSFEGSAAGLKDAMTCEIKDIVALKQAGSNVLKLYYSSNDFPHGQLVANLVIGDETKASLN